METLYNLLNNNNNLVAIATWHSGYLHPWANLCVGFPRKSVLAFFKKKTEKTQVA